MTQNRCAYAPCAATLRPDGPSLYFCDETCQRGWNEAQQSRSTSLPGGPVRGMTPTLVAVDEIANIPDEVWISASARALAEEASQYTWPSHPAARDVEEPVDEMRYAVAPWWQRTPFRRLRKPAARFRMHS